jgi:hypothetical protein
MKKIRMDTINIRHGFTPRNLKDFRDLVLEIPKEFLRALFLIYFSVSSVCSVAKLILKN